MPSNGSSALPNVLEGEGAAIIGARGARAGEPGEVGDKGVRVDGGEGVGAREGGTIGERIPRGLGMTEGGLGLSGRLPGT